MHMIRLTLVPSEHPMDICSVVVLLHRLAGEGTSKDHNEFHDHL